VSQLSLPHATFLKDRGLQDADRALSAFADLVKGASQQHVYPLRSESHAQSEPPPVRPHLLVQRRALVSEDLSMDTIVHVAQDQPLPR
jgi:hypothetical protein